MEIAKKLYLKQLINSTRLPALNISTLISFIFYISLY